MQLFTRMFTVQGLLCMLAFALEPSTTAIAMNPALVQPAGNAVQQQQQQQSPPKPDMQQPNTPQPDQSATKAVVITGMIVKSGSAFVLRDSSGIVYQLDAQEKAQSYEGKSVKVTGKLEAETKILHVDTIEELSA
jgi:hypothetical protein